jgi:hypothetical protein
MIAEARAMAEASFSKVDWVDWRSHAQKAQSTVDETQGVLRGRKAPAMPREERQNLSRCCAQTGGSAAEQV